MYFWTIAALKAIKAEEEKEKVAEEVKKEKIAKQIEESSKYYNTNAKPGSLASKAAMVQKYNKAYKILKGIECLPSLTDEKSHLLAGQIDIHLLFLFIHFHFHVNSKTHCVENGIQEIYGLIVNGLDLLRADHCRLGTKESAKNSGTSFFHDLVLNIAYKVKRTRRPVSLEPMNPYERRIIHSALQNDKYVFTKSEGEDPFRHVVIALKKEERRERRPRYERRERTAGSENSYRSSSQE